MAHLPRLHFLSLPRPSATTPLPPGVPDTSTLAAHDFDIDTRTGFMPPQPPLARLPLEWEPWEAALDQGAGGKLKLANTAPHTASDDNEDAQRSEAWRVHVRAV